MVVNECELEGIVGIGVDIHDLQSLKAAVMCIFDAGVRLAIVLTMGEVGCFLEYRNQRGTDICLTVFRSFSVPKLDGSVVDTVGAKYAGPSLIQSELEMRSRGRYVHYYQRE